MIRNEFPPGAVGFATGGNIRKVERGPTGHLNRFAPWYAALELRYLDENNEPLEDGVRWMAVTRWPTMGMAIAWWNWVMVPMQKASGLAVVPKIRRPRNGVPV